MKEAMQVRQVRHLCSEKEVNAISAYSVFRDVLSFFAVGLHYWRHLHLSDFKLVDVVRRKEEAR